MSKLNIEISNKSKFEWVHVDTCLPDYWAGHHKPTVQIPVYKNMKLKDIKNSIISEISEGAVSGSDDLAFLLYSDFVGADNDKIACIAFNKAIAAANRIKPATKGQKVFFRDLEEDNDEFCDSVYAFFVLCEI